MEIEFPAINAEILSSPTFYSFLTDIKTRVKKSPLYRTSMRDNLASKILQALLKGNESVVTQLCLSTVDVMDWQEITTYLISKFGGALRTQELAVQHHQSYPRISFPLEAAIIHSQFQNIKQHLKATGSVCDMVDYHQLHLSPEAATAFLQQGGFTTRYLTALNEALPLITQSQNIDKLETLSYAEGFKLLEAQLMNLHKSAQNMSNRYCVNMPTSSLLVNHTSPKPEEKPQTKEAAEIQKSLQDLQQQLKILKNRKDREENKQDHRQGFYGNPNQGGFYGNHIQGQGLP